MLVMVANNTGWLVHCLARETGRIGHLYSPDAQRGPYPWLPYACDNGAFACWDGKTNEWDEDAWQRNLPRWQSLMCWAQIATQKPLWCVVPDVIGNAEATLRRWAEYAPQVPFPRAMAVQDGMTPADVLALKVQPDVIAIGGSTEWKWNSLPMWRAAFKRVHLLRCNIPGKLAELEADGIESTDGTGWLRGSVAQTAGLEEWARRGGGSMLWPHWMKGKADDKQGRLF